jgi:hypothetical protein
MVLFDPNQKPALPQWKGLISHQNVVPTLDPSGSPPLWIVTQDPRLPPGDTVFDPSAASPPKKSR